jgi:anti-sigma regulatory factor (Ser/Thr protein kinase)
MGEHVDIDLPLHARSASIVRAVTASVAADAGLSVDEIEDLRMGVNEAVSVLVDVDEPADARLVVRFLVTSDEITVSSSRTGSGPAVTSSDIDVLAARILDAVVDDYGVSDGAFTIVKRVDERR